MDDQRLARWAAERAPHLVRRAEEEAVELLRDALVRSVIGGPTAPPAVGNAVGPAPPAQRRATPARDAETTAELLWAYGVVSRDAELPSGLPGVDPGAAVERIDTGELSALVSRVPASEFGAEPLRDNLNELAWLERVARAHEAVLERVLDAGPVIPLRICTIYVNAENVQQMLGGRQGSFTAALAALSGRQEWGVKVLADPERLAAAARAGDSRSAELEQDLRSTTEGGAYMLRRRMERHLRSLTDALAAEVADEVHARLAGVAREAVTRPPQNRELSGHAGEMLLNAAYLVDVERVEELRGLGRELADRFRDLGMELEVTGPWPPYNFVPGDAGVLT
jgi:hypothetical protein